MKTCIKNTVVEIKCMLPSSDEIFFVVVIQFESKYAYLQLDVCIHFIFHTSQWNPELIRFKLSGINV